MSRNFFKALIFIVVFVFVSSFAAFLFADDTTASSKLPDDVTNYQLTAADKVLLVEPSVCYITSIFYG